MLKRFKKKFKTLNDELIKDSVITDCDQFIDYLIYGYEKEPDTYTFSSWFERDRAHLCLTNDLKDETVLEFWDDDVRDIVESGFIDPRDYEGSMRKYAKYLGVI